MMIYVVCPNERTDRMNAFTSYESAFEFAKAKAEKKYGMVTFQSNGNNYSTIVHNGPRSDFSMDIKEIKMQD